jgi:hypothetical protein
MARVSKVVVERDLQRIKDLLQKHPAGISRKEISTQYSNEYGGVISSRTLQRRLELLVIKEQLIAEGNGPGAIYKPKRVDQAAGNEAAGQVTLSVQGTKLRDSVRRPIIERPHVGYNRDWLFDYTPGKTWYLPKPEREKLHEMGRTPDKDRPAGTFAQDILGRLLIDLAWASSRLEGNTYTRLDTQNLLEFGQRAEGKDAQEAQMILNHKGAIQHLVSGAETIGYNRQTMLAIHAALSENLLGDARDEGRLRERPVAISGTTYTPTAIPQVIQECFDRILETVTRILDPFEQSFFMMVHVPYLQPFVDVNKRTSRLAANIPLILANLCPLSFIDVPQQIYVEATLAIYEQRRVELLRDVYLHAYARSSAQYRVIRESLGQPDPIRLRYRTEIAALVADTVRAMEPPRIEALRERGAALGIEPHAAEAVAERALAQLVNLNEGSAARNQIRPSEFAAWSRAFRTDQSESS